MALTVVLRADAAGRGRVRAAARRRSSPASGSGRCGSWRSRPSSTSTRSSLRYHITRKTGGLSRIIERGVKGVDFLLRFLLFSIVPLILELALVGAILFFVFDVWYLVVVAVTIALYVWFTFRLTEWRVKIRQRMNERDTDANQKAIDSLLNFETVKYFGAEEREAARYDASMQGYEKAAVQTGGQPQLAERRAVAADHRRARRGDGDGGAGRAGGAADRRRLRDGQRLHDPDHHAARASSARSIARSGRAWSTWRRCSTCWSSRRRSSTGPARGRCGSAAGASSSATSSFDYETERSILRGLNLVVEPGQTVAVVGPSGSGKSTIGRLLFRFYDVTGGAVLIDGQDLRDVTQASLRAADRHGAAGHRALQRHDLLQHRLRPAGGEPRRGRGGGAGGADPRLHQPAAAGLRHHGRRARAEALGRREAAGRDRAHAAEGPADPAARRGDERARQRDRARHPGQPAGDGRSGAASS